MSTVPDRVTIPSEIRFGAAVEGAVIACASFGVFVRLTPDLDGVCNALKLTRCQAAGHPSPKDVYRVGEELRTRVITVDRETGKVVLSEVDAGLSDEAFAQRYASVEPRLRG